MTDTDTLQADVPAEAANAALEAELAAQNAPPAEPATAPETPPAPEGEGDDDEDDKPKGGFQRRIAELTRIRRETERDRDHWRELAMQKAQAQPVEQNADPQPPATPEGAPTLEQFGFDESKYHQALDAWIAKRAETAAEAKFKALQAEQAEQQRVREFRSREAEFAKTANDYADVVYNPEATITQEMVEAAQASEDGVKLLYHLAKHQDEAKRIAALPPILAAVEIGKIAAKLTAPPPTAPSVTRAPPPPPRVDDDADADLPVKTTDPSSDRLSDDEWAKAELKRISRR